jgi:exopolysaccharide biosynthesis operon protein EpsL
MNKKHRKAGRALASAMLLAFASQATAQTGDAVDLFVAQSLSYDSNVFRLSDEADAQARIGSDKRSDIISNTQIGINLNLPVSLQRIVASASLNHARYERFSDLDYTSRNAMASWLWQAGDPLNGEIGYSENHSMASMSNLQGRTINPITRRRTFGNANYLLTPNWQVQGALALSEQRNEESTQQVNDIDQRIMELGINYLSTAANKLGLSLRHGNGDLPNEQRIGSTFYDNSFTQRSAGIVTDWTMTAQSRLRARVDQVQREYDQLGERDWNGTTAHLFYDWRTTETFTLTTEIQRDIGSAEDLQTSFVLIKGIALRPKLEVSPKTRLAALLDYSVRDYYGDARTALGGTQRSDTVRVYGVSLDYLPIPSLTIQLLTQRESRTSNQALTDYSANISTLNLRYTF